uniref:phosphatidate cytidylyltransferase, mitochondrial isoform X3 n=1 Tax=Callithrix jacchus TaxID=9483 RepID=UPI0023DD65E6|nr:phosphatidate cytidylyltransferase, mitochondrial isoform X3 [Callithrix jacchus]
MALQALQSSGVTFRRILSHFPEELSLAFAYGSGVYRQAGPNSDQKNAMLDFVFTVDDPFAWHSKNLKKNWNHYSFLKVLGPKMITSIQNNYGAGVYYNSLITCDGRLIKYGVISTSILIEDLLNWNHLYVAGRLQKPVKIVTMNEDITLRSALDRNLKSAVTTAFLMLPESFSEEDLFIEIAGLSYSGDFRMLVGEDKTKVLNIVKPNIAHFRELYGSILQENPQVVYKSQQGRLEVNYGKALLQNPAIYIGILLLGLTISFTWLLFTLQIPLEPQSLQGCIAQLTGLIILLPGSVAEFFLFSAPHKANHPFISLDR